MTISRDFKGIWIPKEVWLDQSLSYFDKLLLAEIHSLDGEDGCFVSNEYLCDFFNEQKRKIQDSLSKLKKLGYIYVESFDGRKRVMRANLTPKSVKSFFSTSAVQPSPSEDKSVKSFFSTSPVSDLAPLSYIENKEDNKVKQQQQAAVVVKDVVVVFSEKNQKPQSKKQKSTLPKTSIDPKKVNILEQYELSDAVHAEFLEKDLDCLEQANALTKHSLSRNEISNPSGMFVKAVRQQWKFTQNQQKIQKDKKDKENTEITEENKKIVKQVHEKLESSFHSDFKFSISDRCVMCKRKEGYQIIEFSDPELKVHLMNYVETHKNHHLTA